ncbi:MAG: LamG domain-containing protein [Kiritimatiellaeota bacterium]|nr:LamG domain-containing protein [Kiritimatiellota bacterium]
MMFRGYSLAASRRDPSARRPPLTAVRLAAGLWLALAAGTGPRAADLPPGLVLHFSFDDASAGGVIADRSGHNLSGRVLGAKWTFAGKQGGGYEFTSTNSYIVVSNTPALTPKQMTLALWFKTAKADAQPRWLLDKAADSGYALSLGGDAPDEQRRGRLCFAVSGQACWSAHSVADGIWHHGAAAFDGERLKLYVDGQLQPQVVVWRGEPAANAHDLTLGLNRSNPAPQEQGLSFEGVLDEVMLFNHALTDAELQSVLAATRSRFTRDQVARRVQEIKGLYDRGLLRKDFYDRKVKECEAQ